MYTLLLKVEDALSSTLTTVLLLLLLSLLLPLAVVTAVVATAFQILTLFLPYPCHEGVVQQT